MYVDWLLLSLRLFAVVVLYVFLAIAVYVIWLDLRSGVDGGSKLSPSHAPDSTAPVPIASVVMAAASSPAETPLREFGLVSQTRIGRAEDNDIVLADDCVSSRHAEVVFRDGNWWLNDLASRNGTLLNGAAIDSPVVLRHGDAIGVGNVVLNLNLKRDTES